MDLILNLVSRVRKVLSKIIMFLLGSGHKHPFSLLAHGDAAESDLPGPPSDDLNPFSPICKSFSTPCPQTRGPGPRLNCKSK